MHVPPALAFMDADSCNTVVEHLLSAYPDSSDLNEEQRYLCDLLGEKVGQTDGAITKLMMLWRQTGRGTKTNQTFVKPSELSTPVGAEMLITSSLIGSRSKENRSLVDAKTSTHHGAKTSESNTGKSDSRNSVVKENIASTLSNTGHSRKMEPMNTPAPTKLVVPLPVPPQTPLISQRTNLKNCDTTNPESVVVPTTPCGCMATKHDLAGSCSACGRAYCVQEQWILSQTYPLDHSPANNNKSASSRKLELETLIGTGGQCLFCGLFACYSAMTADMLRSRLTADTSLRRHDAVTLQELQNTTLRAYNAKDRLLQFDREHAKRTHVHDSQADYYETSTWLSPEEKASIDRRMAKKQASRIPSNRKYKITLDIAGRRVFTQEQEHWDDERSQNEDDMLEAMQSDDEEGLLSDALMSSSFPQNIPTNSVNVFQMTTSADIVSHRESSNNLQGDRILGSHIGLAQNPHTAGQVYRLLQSGLAPWRTAPERKDV